MILFLDTRGQCAASGLGENGCRLTIQTKIVGFFLQEPEQIVVVVSVHVWGVQKSFKDLQVVWRFDWQSFGLRQQGQQRVQQILETQIDPFPMAFTDKKMNIKRSAYSKKWKNLSWALIMISSVLTAFNFLLMPQKKWILPPLSASDSIVNLPHPFPASLWPGLSDSLLGQLSLPQGVLQPGSQAKFISDFGGDWEKRCRHGGTGSFRGLSPRLVGDISLCPHMVKLPWQCPEFL